MEQKASHFLTRENITPSDILYVIHQDRKTVFYLADGTQKESYLPLKYFFHILPDHSFLNITKGVVLSSFAIHRIDKGIYTMIDGRQFTGRKRGAGEHKRNRQQLGSSLSQPSSFPLTEPFAILDQAPMACFVLQAVSDKNGHILDLVFRYCNRAMLTWENCTAQEWIDHSFNDFLHGKDFRWMDLCRDVIKNGSPQICTEYDKIHRCHVTIHCYRPADHYCICCLIPEKILS